MSNILRLRQVHPAETRDKPSSARHVAHIPYHQLPIYTRSADLRHISALRLIRANISDGVLVNRHEFGPRVRLTADRRALTARISVTERVECCTVESSRAYSKLRRPGRLGGRGVIETAYYLPPCLRSREQDRLAVMTSRNDGIFSGPGQTDKGKGGDPDVVYGGTTGVDDVDGAIVA